LDREHRERHAFRVHQGVFEIEQLHRIHTVQNASPPGDRRRSELQALSEDMDGASALASKQLSPERARARHTADAIADSAGVGRRGDLITGQMYHGGRWRRLNRLSNDDDD